MNKTSAKPYLTGGIYQPKGKAGEYSRYACNLYFGCGHGCKYPCYVPAMLRMKPADWHALKPTPRKDILRHLEKDATRLATIELGAEVFLCFTSDPYHGGNTSATREAIRIIGAAGLVPVICTKGGTRAERDFDLMKQYGGKFGTTMVFYNDGLRKQFEPHAPSIEDRIDAIQIAHYEGIYTFVSLEPVIDPREALQVIRNMARYVRHWKVGKINYDPVRECAVDWHEFYKEATRILDSVGADYYVKEGLRAYA